MVDRYAGSGDDLLSPASDGAAVTPSDSANLPTASKRLWVGGAGNVSLITIKGTPLTYAAVPAGSYLNVRAQQVKATNLAAPSAPVLSAVAGGTLAATTYYVKITYVTASGETLPSSESSLAVALDNVLSVAAPASATGATGWNVYVSTATGTETKQNTSPIAIGTAWQEPTSGLIAGSAQPTSNTTGTTATNIVAEF